MKVREHKVLHMAGQLLIKFTRLTYATQYCD